MGSLVSERDGEMVDQAAEKRSVTHAEHGASEGLTTNGKYAEDPASAAEEGATRPKFVIHTKAGSGQAWDGKKGPLTRNALLHKGKGKALVSKRMATPTEVAPPLVGGAFDIEVVVDEATEMPQAQPPAVGRNGHTSTRTGSTRTADEVPSRKRAELIPGFGLGIARRMTQQVSNANPMPPSSTASQLSARRLAGFDDRQRKRDLKAKVTSLVDRDDEFAQQLAAFVYAYEKKATSAEDPRPEVTPAFTDCIGH